MILSYEDFINENKTPEWKDSDAPDAEGRFKKLGIRKLAAWLIRSRKRDLKKISGSITQQIVFNRGKDPKYAEKMEKVRKEVYRQLGREDLLKESSNFPHEIKSETYWKKIIDSIPQQNNRKYVLEVFDTVMKKQQGFASDRQMALLKRAERGDTAPYHTKN